MLDSDMKDQSFGPQYMSTEVNAGQSSNVIAAIWQWDAHCQPFFVSFHFIPSASSLQNQFIAHIQQSTGCNVTLHGRGSQNFEARGAGM